MSQSDEVVIFGGAGFIGRHLVSALKGRVTSIRVASRSLRTGTSVERGVEYVRADVTDARAVDEVVRGASVVYQLTVEGDMTRGADNVASACLAHGVRRLVFASTSDALYLGEPGTLDENAGPDARPELRNAYARGKVESERLLRRYHRERGLPVVVVRPALVVGPGGRLSHGGVGIWSGEVCLLGWGDGKNPMPFVLVQDVASALVAAMDAPGIEGRSFNLAGDVFLSAREYVELLRARTGRNFRFYPRNLAWLWAIDQVKGLVRKALRMPADEPASYRDLKSSAMLTHIDNSAARRWLGWRPNASLDLFVREAIDSHVEPLAVGDPRLAPSDLHRARAGAATSRGLSVGALRPPPMRDVG